MTGMTVRSLDDVRPPRARTWALTGSSCYLADRLAATLVLAGDHVVLLRPPGHDDLATARLAHGHGAAATASADLTAGPGTWDVLEHHPDDAVLPPEVEAGVDVVVHFADGPEEDSLRGFSGATLATLFALKLAGLNDARLVIASLPGNADHLHADEALAAGYRSSHDVDAVLARVAEPYGPGMPTGRGGVVAQMLAEADQTGTVLVGAADRDRHSVCFVDDVVDGLLELADGHAEGPVYLGPDVEAPTVQLAREVARATGADYQVVERRGRRRTGPTPVRAVSGEHPEHWHPTVALADGLQRCVDDVVDLTAGRPVHLSVVADDTVAGGVA